MPNRILRDWTDSFRIEKLSAESERLFTRLIMKADDFGRFHADPRLIRSNCFPLVEVSDGDICRWLTELSENNLIMVYESKGKSLLSICEFRQRTRLMMSKFPPPDGHASDWVATHDGQVTVTCQSDDGQVTARGAGARRGGDGGRGGQSSPQFSDEDIQRVLKAYPKQQGTKGAVYQVRQAIMELHHRGVKDAVDSLIMTIEEYAASDVVKRGKVFGVRKFFEEGHYDDDQTTWADAKKESPEERPDAAWSPMTPEEADALYREPMDDGMKKMSEIQRRRKEGLSILDLKSNGEKNDA